MLPLFKYTSTDKKNFMEKALVDIVIPTYNRKELLKRAVQSVQNQSYKNWKLFIVDDGSTDGTKNISYGKKINIITSKNNRGVSHARNQGIKHGKADWIAFLDSDDEWLPEKLEKQIKYAKNHPQYPLIHCNEVWFKNGKTFNQKKKHKKQGGRIFIPSVKLCCISPSAVLIKRSLFKTTGLFKESFPVCEDYELWLRITSRYNVGFIDEPLLIKHGGHKDQLSKKYFAMDYWRVKALIPYLKDNNLSQEERETLKKILLAKCKILLKGYTKHKNFKDQKEIETIYKQTLLDKDS